MHLVLGYVLPSIVTAALHVCLLWLMTENWDRDEVQHFVKPQMINARLVSIEQVQPKAKPAPKPTPRKAAPAKPKPKPKPAAKPKVDLAKQKAEQERRERLAKQREQERRQREQQEQLAVVLAEEEQFLVAKSQEEIAMSQIGAIQQAISNSWSRPPSARRDMEVSLLISLIPTGEVVTVRVLDGSGNNAFDRSAINAVNKAERFPALADLPSAVFERYFRELRLVFRPEDLRL